MAPRSHSSLPLEPPVYSQLQHDNDKLLERNKFLEDVIEVLSVQNQQYLTTIKKYQAHEKVISSKINRVHRASRDLRETREESSVHLRESDEKIRRLWDRFCEKKKIELGPDACDPWDYWKNLKLRIMTKTYQDLVIDGGV
ncbi:hypothetical protein DL95DRAFT_471766 [Leptodontidium sp. 2 PMI_412]|nr:hypothetical protein DL95DRAFT_471766 [Leptodontidium sp. 2 PMI_412]